MDLTRGGAAALDAADPLAGFRQRFTGTEDDAADRLLYLDGNSLGRLPGEPPAAVARVVERQWGEGLVGSWADWIGEATRLGDALAAGVLGARPGEVLVADSTSVNLYKLPCAALDAYSLSAQRALVTDTGNFPTDRYVLEGIAEQRGLQLRLFDSADPLL